MKHVHDQEKRDDQSCRWRHLCQEHKETRLVPAHIKTRESICCWGTCHQANAYRDQSYDQAVQCLPWNACTDHCLPVCERRCKVKIQWMVNRCSVFDGGQERPEIREDND